MCSIAHVKAALNVHTVGDQLIDFREERFGVEHNTITYRAPNAAMQNSARDLMQNERFFTDVDCVACVCSTLVSNDPIGALGENVNEFSLPFIPPLGANNYDCTSF
jgi:hypothetical protein